ncbi:MAG: hypothetical protein NTW48_06790 [Chloroflexi bacterium]|nr:hypothetical protein [Chloroflexota bacterium]
MRRIISGFTLTLILSHQGRGKLYGQTFRPVHLGLSLLAMKVAKDVTNVLGKYQPLNLAAKISKL